MGNPPLRIVAAKLVKRFFKKMQMPRSAALAAAEQDLLSCWSRYGYGSGQCMREHDKFNEEAANQRTNEERFRDDMKKYPGIVLSYMVPPVNRYLRKGHHGPPRLANTLKPLNDGKIRKSLK